jgi:hypothetical protein
MSNFATYQHGEMHEYIVGFLNTKKTVDEAELSLSECL